jgi:hypothetical protein
MGESVGGLAGIVPEREGLPETKLQTANATLQRNLKPQAVNFKGIQTTWG